MAARRALEDWGEGVVTWKCRSSVGELGGAEHQQEPSLEVAIDSVCTCRAHSDLVLAISQ